MLFRSDGSGDAEIIRHLVPDGGASGKLSRCLGSRGGGGEEESHEEEGPRLR